VLQDEPAGKMTGLAEQGALAGTQGKKEGLSPMEERAGHSRGVTGVFLGHAERKLDRQKPS